MMTKEAISLAGEQEKGKLGIAYLKRIWSSAILEQQGLTNAKEQTKYNYVKAVCNSLGIGIEPTYKYLFEHSPTFDEFEDWIATTGFITPEMVEIFNNAIAKGYSTEIVATKDYTAEQKELLQQWDEYGYVIIRNAVPKEDCEATVKLIHEYLQMDEKDPTTWYNPHPLKQGIMIQLFNHEQLVKNRLSKKIRDAYKLLWPRTDLMVSTDRVGFNPPETETYKFQGPRLHWDVSLKLPIPLGLQGILYLTDTAENQGAFTLVPGFHQKIESWLGSLEKGKNPREQNLYALGPKPIAANGGDFIIWHHALPHGSSPNTSQKPRIVQYINYLPLHQEIQSEWI